MKRGQVLLIVALVMVFSALVGFAGRLAWAKVAGLRHSVAEKKMDSAQTTEDDADNTIVVYENGKRKVLTYPANPDAYWGTRERPVPLGKMEQAGHVWAIQILDVNPDAWPVIKAENMYNDPPEKGKQYVMIRFKIKSIWDDPREPYGDLKFKYLGNDGIAYAGSCGVIPDDLYDVPEMYPGAITEANECFVVPSHAISGGSIVVDAEYKTQVFFEGVPKSDE